MTNLECYKDYIIEQINKSQMDSFRKDPCNSFIRIIEKLMNESLPDYPEEDQWFKILTWLSTEVDLLTKEDKDYLRMMEEFHNIKIISIKKVKCDEKDRIYGLQILYKSEIFNDSSFMDSIPFPNSKFKKLKVNELYTIKGGQS